MKAIFSLNILMYMCSLFGLTQMFNLSDYLTHTHNKSLNYIGTILLLITISLSTCLMFYLIKRGVKLLKKENK
jgi:hypothetical protein